jgi:hypothetical protein
MYFLWILCQKSLNCGFSWDTLSNDKSCFRKYPAFFHKTFGSMLKVAWIMSFLPCVPTGSLFTRRKNRRITTEKTCYVGSNKHLCLEFYVNIVRYIVVIFYRPLQIAISIYVMKHTIKLVFIYKNTYQRPTFLESCVASLSKLHLPTRHSR